MHPNQKLRRLVDLPPQERLAIGQMMKVNMTHINSPRNFALQPTCNEPTLDIITDYCAELPDVHPELDVVLVGTLWGAVFREDGLWYRALIQSIDEAKKLARVYFIDYGNSETVSTETDLRWLSEDLMKFPPQLLECQWHHAGTNPNAQEKLEVLMDVVDPLTVTVVETKYAAKEMNQVIGSGQCGSVVVTIQELDSLEKAFLKPTLETVVEIDSSDMESDSMDSESSGGFGSGSDSVDGPKNSAVEVLEVSREESNVDDVAVTSTEPKAAEMCSTEVQAPTSVSTTVEFLPTVCVEDKAVIQPMDPVVVPLQPAAESLAFVQPVARPENLVLVSPAPAVELQSSAEPVMSVANTAKTEQATTGRIPPKARAGPRPTMDAFQQFTGFCPSPRVVENGIANDGLHELKLMSLESKMKRLEFTSEQLEEDIKAFFSFSEGLLSTFNDARSEAAELNAQQVEVMEQAKAEIGKLKAEIEQLTPKMVRLEELVRCAKPAQVAVPIPMVVVEHNFASSEEELKFRNIELKAERNKNAYLMACMSEKDKLLTQNRIELMAERQHLLEIVAFKEEEIKELRGRLGPNVMPRI